MKHFDELKKYNFIVNNEHFKKLNKYFAHGKTTTMAHSLNVTKMALKVSSFLKLRINRNELILSSLLHDLFFYDWHKAPKKVGLHGFSHAKIAAENAKKIFGVNERVVNNIKSHMWPLNITKFPRTKVAVLLCIVDKICAVKETFNI